MRVSDGWKDYQVIDTSCGEKLEKWGDYTLVRPDPQVIWDTPKKEIGWKKKNGHYHRSAKGGGEWEFFDLPEEWSIHYKGTNNFELTFNLKPFSFKHTGLFPEQAVNWDWFSSIIMKAKKENPERQIKVLNLFAYTGAATVSALKAGASVVHVDASKGMVQWAKENAASTGVADRSVRWIVDDCMKFVQREIRRGKKYDAIIMDPPSYGRGPGGEVWKIETELFGFVQQCAEVLSDNPLFVLLNSYTTGLSAATMANVLTLTVGKKFGGVATAEDVIEMMLAGATAVEIGAANLVNPYACRDIIADLPAAMKKYGIESLSEIIGGVK